VLGAMFLRDEGLEVGEELCPHSACGTDLEPLTCACGSMGLDDMELVIGIDTGGVNDLLNYITKKLSLRRKR
jgi:hypothetical protein